MKITFSAYLVNVRMEKAAQLLQTTNYRVYEVAEMIGYSNLSYFSKQFKEKYGITPFDYRNQRVVETR